MRKRLRNSLAMGALLGATLLVGCAEKPDLDVIVLNFPDAATNPYRPSEYEPLLFSEGSYRRTPRGRPAWGSAREWFLLQSNGAHLLTGTIRPSTFTSTRTWADVRSDDVAYNRDPEQGRWWVSGIIEAARDVVGFAQDPNQWDAKRILVLHNAPAANGGWTAGSYVVMGGAEADGDIRNLGVFTHELGHALHGQSDRYSFRFGGLGIWDNMADDYDNFPAGYTGYGRIEAGWAHWSPELTRGSELFRSTTATLRDVRLTESVQRFKASPAVRGPLADANIHLELRAPDSERELALASTNAPVTLFHWDPSEAILAPTRTYAMASYSLLHPGYAFATLFDTLPAFSLPARPPTRDFRCVSGLPLNSYGECVWEFYDVATGRTNSGTQATAAASWRVEHHELLGTGLRSGWEMSPSPEARRAYFVVQGDLAVHLSPRAGEREKIVRFSTDSPAQAVLDLDGLSNGGTLWVESLGREASLTNLAVVVRTGASPQTQQRYPEQAHRLRGSFGYWGSSLASLAPNENANAIFSVSSPSIGSRAGYYSLEGFVRLIVAYTDDIDGPPSLPANPTRAQQADFQETLEVWSNGVARAWYRPRSGLAVKIAPNREGPFVALLPISVLAPNRDGLGWQNPVELSLMRSHIRTNAQLRVLAADFVPAP